MSYTAPPRGDVKRLPKWAQEYITGLERHIERQDTTLERLSSKHPDSNVVLDAGWGQPSMTLPSDSTVRFYLSGDRNLIEIRPNLLDRRQLEVTSYGGRFGILPLAGNSISLRLED